MLNLLKTTKNHTDYWANRKINWVDHYAKTWDHPHRQFMIDKLKTMRWVSVIEVGCACGPNLMRIVSQFPRADVGGVDINADAINTAREWFDQIFKGTLRRSWFKVNSGDDIMISDDSTDIILTDMTLIYVGPRKIKKYLAEMKRVTRNHIMLMEFHSRNPLKRLWLKLKSGYNSYDYRKLLEEQGFYNIQVDKLPPELWDNHNPQKDFAYLITAQK
jgi:ubiquinone/menaquinone biosynthesis C-methylase UbiE